MSRFDIGDNVIDSRELIERYEELAGELEEVTDAMHEARAALDAATGDASRLDELADLDGEVIDTENTFNEWLVDYGSELDMLRDACEDGAASPDWTYGTTLVHDSYFTEYVMDMLADIGDLPRDIPWYIVIDRDATADNVKADYFNIDLDGETYWISA